MTRTSIRRLLPDVELRKAKRKKPRIFARTVGICTDVGAQNLWDAGNKGKLTSFRKASFICSKYFGANSTRAFISAADISLMMKRSSGVFSKGTHQHLSGAVHRRCLPLVLRKPEPDFPPWASHFAHLAKDSMKSSSQRQLRRRASN